jgi:hypothetical protein
MHYIKIDSALLQTTKTAWLAQSGDNAHKTAILFLGIEQSLSLKISTYEECYFGIFTDEQESDCLAICSMVITKLTSRKWVKMLNLDFAPHLDDLVFERDITALKQYAEIYVKAVTATIELATTQLAKTVKVFARNHVLLDFLKLFQTTLNAQTSIKLNVTMEGRWLVIQQ